MYGSLLLTYFEACAGLGFRDEMNQVGDDEGND